MKHIFYQLAIIALALLLTLSEAFAQKKDTTIQTNDNVKIIITTDGDTVKKRKGLEGLQISIGTNGLRISDPTVAKKKHKKLHTQMHFDFGFNNILDNTNYTNPGGSGVLVGTDSSVRNLTENDLTLKNGRSINFNFWPVWLAQDVAKHNVQIETGLGFQFFNYRYETTVRHADNVVDPSLILTNPNQPIGQSGFQDISNPNELTGKEKNKLGVSYVSIPLMIRFNSDKKKGHRYFVGAGVIGSYKLKSWTKFYGDKESGNYAINDWMTQVTAELGVTGIIKLYGTYALQSMYNNGLDRQPFAIGIRL